MKILAWNARGIPRPAFRRNVAIISETRISKDNTLKICKNLPFNAAEMIKPLGLTKGILILILVKLESDLFHYHKKGIRALQSIIQVTSSNISFVLTAINASSVHKSILE